MTTERPPLILASASPRRRQLLAEAGYTFEVEPSNVPEPAPFPGEASGDYAAGLAWRKASVVAARRTVGIVLGADTVCVVGGEILGKPIDREDAERMLRAQEGDVDILVLTGLCLRKAGADEWVGAIETSVCHCRTMTDPERANYLDSGLWEGKAGGYGVQDRDPFVRVVRGSWSNVVGLPLERLDMLLRAYPELTR